MFISQVLFESSPEHETTLRAIMQKKLSGSKDAHGLLSMECWRKETAGTVGYALVSKWMNKSAFQAWLSAEHQTKGHQGHRQEGAERPPIQKTTAQYEVMDAALLR